MGKSIHKHSPSLVNQSYWDKNYQYLKLNMVPQTDQIRQLIEKYFHNGHGECFEVGCFPGQYLAVFGRLGYKISGLDLNPRTNQELPSWFKSLGYKIGRFEIADFLKYLPTKTYDLVCSFGFIEHFPNWESVLLKHLAFVKPGGYLLITTPNFKGAFQRLIHLTLDKQNYHRHFIPSMNPTLWAKILQVQGFEIVMAKNYGHFEFWVEDQPRNKLQIKMIERLALYAPKLYNTLPEGNKMYAPYCVLIARRIK